MANRRLRKELLETARGLHAADAIDFKKLQEFETFRLVQAPAPFVPPSAPLRLRASYRHGNPPDIGLDMVGFRCAGDD